MGFDFRGHGMTVGSLFSGIGGIDLAFERAGFTIAWQVEIDRQAISVLARHWPTVKRKTDVNECGKDNLSPVDIIVGGFPCQSFSIAGKREGLANAQKSGLWSQMLRITNELQPKYLLWENVPGLFSANRGRDFATILCQLANIGYFGCWRTLDGQYFGVPQRRRRVFGLFARRDIGARSCYEILFESESLCRHSSPCRKARKSIAATIRGRSSSSGVSAPGRGGEDDTNIVVVRRPIQELSDGIGGTSGGYASDTERMTFIPTTAYSVNAKRRSGWMDGESETLITHSLRGIGFDASEDGTGRGTPLVPGVRRLTPRECERLQSLPDDWTRFEDTGKEIADGPRYRMIGNGVVVNCLNWIAKRIREHG